MTKTCIITDELAQFLDLSFDGQDLVHLMPVQVLLDGKKSEEIAEMKPGHLPYARTRAAPPRLSSPSVEDFAQEFIRLSKTHSEIVAVLSSGQFTPCVANAEAAAQQTRGSCRVSIVDTRAIGVGLGILVASAATYAAAGMGASEIKRRLLGLAEKVYAVFCVRNLSYLHNLGLASPAQAMIGEYLELHQMYYLNAGTLVPVQKIRNSRHMVESLLEFVAEFEDPRRVALQQSATGFHNEARTIRERLTLEYPGVGISEMALTMPLAALFGPQTFGLYLWEIES